jgi:anthranilate phosphoribosyltransferase
MTLLTSANAAPTDPKAFIPFVQAVGRGEKLKRDLTQEEAVTAMRMILRRSATDAQIGGFLIAQRVKGETVEEILGFTQVVRAEFMQQIAPKVENLLDLAAPYDGKVKTAQLAPAIAVVLAAAGVPVILHGDEGVPTKEGVTPGLVLANMGVAVDLTPEQVARMLERVGVGYLAARHYAPAWHALTPLRREFGLRTVLNSVEKLFNPANAPYQISGFFHGGYIERLRVTQTGRQRSWMVQGEEGSIEMASGRKTHIYAEAEPDDWILEPAEVGLAERVRIELPPNASQHAQVNLAILRGSTSPEISPAADQVAFSVAAILTLLGAQPGLAAALDHVRTLLRTGAVKRRLEQAQAVGD